MPCPGECLWNVNGYGTTCGVEFSERREARHDYNFRKAVEVPGRIVRAESGRNGSCERKPDGSSDHTLAGVGVVALRSRTRKVVACSIGIKPVRLRHPDPV